MKYFTVTFLIISVNTLSQASTCNRCPDVQGVDNFSLADYSNGFWYEIGRYYGSFLEPSEDCSTAKYSYDGDVGRVQLYNVKGGACHQLLLGNLTLAPDACNTGSVIYNFNDASGNALPPIPIKIVATDYKNYAVLYNCMYDESSDTVIDYAWFQVKDELDGVGRKYLDDYIKNSDIIDISKIFYETFNRDTCGGPVPTNSAVVPA